MIAMEMIIICHIMQYYDFVLAWWFNIGVQIFLCISGFLYGRKAIENIARFYNQRIKKILVPYYLTLIPFAFFEFAFCSADISFKNLLEAIGADETPTFIMPTYTAMFDLRGEISKHTDIKAFYE